MSIISKAQLEAMRRVGAIVRLALTAMREQVRPGITTAELDRIAAEILAAHDAHSAPQKVYKFPGVTCISVNEEIVHGIPGGRRIEPGDVVKLDVTVEKDGYIADSAATVLVPPVARDTQRLVDCVELAFQRALEVARVGNRVNDIGRAVEEVVRERGFAVVRELTGHGVGRTIHEAPTVPNYFDPRHDAPLTEGLVLAVEPIISAGSGRAVESPDGWTIKTADGAAAAHHEHTLVITNDRPILLTAA